jgi:hypothetical protein
MRLFRRSSFDAFLMNGRTLASPRRSLEPSPLEERPQIIEGDAPLDLHERSLDHMLELRRIERARPAEGQEMAPGFRSEPSAFVRAKDSDGHG